MNTIKFRFQALRARRKADKLAKNDIVKLHPGCGTVYHEGWINIDNNSDGNIECLVLCWYLTNLLPFKDNSVDFISIIS